MYLSSHLSVYVSIRLCICLSKYLSPLSPSLSECDAPSVLTSDKSCSLDDVLQLLRLLYVISQHDKRKQDAENDDPGSQVGKQD